MKYDRKQELESLTLEQQRHEAQQDRTGRVKRYLELAEKFLRILDNDDNSFPSAA